MAIKYIRSFDGLRGIGALMILLYHWPYTRFAISHGWEFMQMFFVMSGYLITLVLLEEKNRYTFGRFAVRFYAKRSLRLFPLYFAYLIGAVIIFQVTSHFNLTDRPFADDVAKHGVYLFTYTFNWMNIINFFAGWDYSSNFWATHLWTLSMEEQFYLVFPFMVFWLSVKQLRRLTIFCIFGAFLFRIVSYEWYKYLNPDDNAWIVQNLVRIPFSQMDSFAFGALLALFPLKFIRNARQWFIAITLIVVAAYATNMAYVYYIQGDTYWNLTYGKKLAEGWLAHNYLFVYMITMVNAWCAILILFLVRSPNGNWFMELQPLVWFGRLSYGFYLLHLPILFVFYKVVKQFIPRTVVLEHWYIELGLLVIFITITTWITHMIHIHFERRFLDLKNKWFKRAQTPQEQQPVATLSGSAVS